MGMIDRNLRVASKGGVTTEGKAIDYCKDGLGLLAMRRTMI
jgi:hypothetical protein